MRTVKIASRFLRHEFEVKRSVTLETNLGNNLIARCTIGPDRRIGIEPYRLFGIGPLSLAPQDIERLAAFEFEVSRNISTAEHYLVALGDFPPGTGSGVFQEVGTVVDL